MADLLDPDLLSAIDAIPGRAFSGSVRRVTWASRDPLAANHGGGRWSPDGRFEVLYTSLEADGALAEVYYHLSRAPVMSSSHMRLNQLNATLKNVLALTTEQLRELGVDDPLASRIDSHQGRAVGEAAFMLDFQGLIVPSARWDCNNLVLFTDRIELNKDIHLQHQAEINWPAWRERADKMHKLIQDLESRAQL
ncbi:MAG: RES family NAD+ phosphorylase [Woeseia sp.]